MIKKKFLICPKCGDKISLDFKYNFKICSHCKVIHSLEQTI